MNFHVKSIYGNRSGLIAVFLFFSYVTFSFFRIQSDPGWARYLIIALVALATGTAITLVFVLLMSLFSTEKTRIWISRVLRAASVAFLAFGSLVLPFLKLSLGVRRDTSFENFAYIFSRNLDELFVVQEWTFMGSAFAVASFALWRNRYSALIAAAGMVLFHYCLLRPSSAWFWR